KKMLRDKKNFGILEGFLSELLKEDIKIEGLLESEGNQEEEDDKFNRVDLFAENSKGEHIIIEIQNTRELDYLMRMLFATSKAIMEYLPIGAKYGEIKKVIAVSIVYFDLGKGEDYVYIGQTKFKGLHTKTELQLTSTQKKLLSKPTVHQAYPEYYLIRTTKFNDIVNDTLDEWIYFFKNSEVLDEFRAKGMSEVRERLKVMNLPDDERKKYNRFLENLHDEASYAETIKIEAEEAAAIAAANAARKVEDEFREDERKKEKVDTAKKSIKMGFTNEQISVITDLSIEEIEILRGIK
ncbi:MAG: Rpn family recombination-promoting nuclease/putative transposase, partial [Saprospiraceae bacterium]|nr:Rpn family recombination-promoting nuclease/putative transposase [Saprospiraceae bacterium]